MGRNLYRIHRRKKTPSYHRYLYTLHTVNCVNPVSKITCCHVIIFLKVQLSLHLLFHLFTNIQKARFCVRPGAQANEGVAFFQEIHGRTGRTFGGPFLF